MTASERKTTAGQLPLEPKPPAPRSESESSSTLLIIKGADGAKVYDMVAVFSTEDPLSDTHQRNLRKNLKGVF